MRVVKVVEYGIHTAFIGGAFVLLGGVALADSAVPATGNSTQPVPQSVTNVDTSVGSTTTVTNDQTNSSSTANVSNDSSNTTEPGNVKNTTTASQTTTSPADNSGSNADTSKAATVPQSSNSQGSEATKDKNASASLQSSDQAVVAAPIITQNIPAQPVQSSVPVVFFHSQALPIKPVITQTQAVGDLASSVPTLPTPESAPLPPKPNSALGHLTGLAATFVPTVLFGAGTPIRLGLTALLLPVFLLLLLSAFVSNYGLWLRRGGFATAARSDAPSRNVFSPFATPHFLGYVFAPPRIHNPVFVVAEIKTGVKK